MNPMCIPILVWLACACGATQPTQHTQQPTPQPIPAETARQPAGSENAGSENAGSEVDANSDNPHLRFVEAAVREAEINSEVLEAEGATVDWQRLRQAASAEPSEATCLEIGRRFHEAALEAIRLRIRSVQEGGQAEGSRRAEVRREAYLAQVENFCGSSRDSQAGTSEHAHVNLVRLEARLAEVSVVYGARHPTRLELQAQVTALSNNIGATAPDPNTVCPEVQGLLQESELASAGGQTRYGAAHPGARQLAERLSAIRRRLQQWCQP